MELFAFLFSWLQKGSLAQSMGSSARSSHEQAWESYSIVCFDPTRFAQSVLSAIQQRLPVTQRWEQATTREVCHQQLAWGSDVSLGQDQTRKLEPVRGDRCFDQLGIWVLFEGTCQCWPRASGLLGSLHMKTWQPGCVRKGAPFAMGEEGRPFDVNLAHQPIDLRDTV